MVADDYRIDAAAALRPKFIGEEGVKLRHCAVAVHVADGIALGDVTRIDHDGVGLARREPQHFGCQVCRAAHVLEDRLIRAVLVDDPLMRRDAGMRVVHMKDGNTSVRGKTGDSRRRQPKRNDNKGNHEIFEMGCKKIITEMHGRHPPSFIVDGKTFITTPWPESKLRPGVRS
ncbi:MAG TPA: hypothetical protein VFG19_14880 [Geobacteraceae bacterium]|nr:hypothetical protein [Geobacteraceae bacterium]